VTATTIVLVRHGETDWNRDGRVQGHSDTPLNETGLLQAAELADVLRADGFSAVYSSDLARARSTAAPVADRYSLEVTPHSGLRERHFGTWEGLRDVEIAERFPTAVADGRWGDGETSEEMTQRVLDTLLGIARDHPGETVLVVSHGGPIRAVLRHATGNGSGPIANCAVVGITIEDGVVRAVD
jgi:2,3-bisphosphoglycerate-dependent phosphoglycerate mutase